MDTERCNFYVGQRVTPCVPVNHRRAREEGLRYGAVYTIAAIQVVDAYVDQTYGSYVALLFKELKHTPVPKYPQGVGWYWRNFRPVTDISSLEALLTAHPTKTPEPVT